MSSEPPTQARVDLPDWLWGGDPEQFLKECGYRTRLDSGGYLVQPQERYLRQPPDLVRCRTVVGSGVAPKLQTLVGYRERIDSPMQGRLQLALEQRKMKAESTKRLVDLLNYERLALYATPVKDLPDRAEHLIKVLQSCPLAEKPGVYGFQDVGLDVVDVDRTLAYRLKLAAVLVQIGQDERLSAGDASHLQTELSQGRLAFDSSAGLHQGHLLLDAYLTPLLAALSPHVWGFAVPRTFGALIFGLGATVGGIEGDAAELLQLVSIPGAHEAKPVPAISSGAAAGATRWWTERLNRLFGVLSDLAVFTDRAGAYRPGKHLEAMLTVEQIFRRTGSLLVAQRDTNARRTLMFSVIDSVTRTNGWDLETMFTLSHAQKVFESLEVSVPAGAADIVLPAARDGVSALRRMEDGFFIRRQLQTADIELSVDGGGKGLSVEKATALYLKALRNATHGHGGQGSARSETSALLAHHDGEIPHDIGHLAYLYLLDMLANPERLRRCFYRSGQ